MASLALASNALAQSDEIQPVQESDPLAQESDALPESEDQDYGPEVRVRQAGTTTVKEYHQQGQTYKVEIEPKNTPAYILTDQDGNGSLNSSDTRIDNDLVVPEWTIGNW